MYECLNLFSGPTRAWFKHVFDVPTAAQSQAWPVIHAGGNALVVAPTGSGKTLCAFLSAIDRLMTGEADRLNGSGAMTAPKGAADVSGERRRTRRVKVLYVSPLKALAVDVAKNLRAPLDGIAAECEASGLAAPDIGIAIRSGDTTTRERRAIASHPPDILVTTPESLYLLLTSKARVILRDVETVILDEVHAVAGTKRGAHLAVSLERLDALAGHATQRIGLSATVRPVDEVARFVGGIHPVTVINPQERPAMDLRVVEPLENMRDLQSANVPGRAGGVGASAASAPHISGVTPAMRRLAERRGLPVSPDRRSVLVSPEDSQYDSQAITGAAGDRAGGSIWPVIERDVLDQVLSHRTTLVFVNSRGLAEKLTARLNDLYAQDHGTDAAQTQSPEGRSGFSRHYDPVVGSTTMLARSHDDGDVIAMAHHGSVSKERRKRIEEQLKHGLLRCVVATSSLELGIDMGSVDLVIQISPPLSVSSGLQRIGRADHRVGGVSHALIYPLTREQIIGAAASVESMRAGDIEPISVIRNPLDVLAQQTVAAASMEDLRPDDWYATVCRSAPFRDLDRGTFDSVMGMMTGAYDSEDFSAFRPCLMWNHDEDLISARPGAQRLAVTSGGTIPDRGLYTVVLPETDGGKGPRRVGELDEEMVYESRVGDIITLGTSTWQIQEITRDRVIVTPAPGRTARLPFWHGDGSGRDCGFGTAEGAFIRQVCTGLTDAAEAGHPRFDTATADRLHDDGLDDNAVENLARLLAEQRKATGVVPDDRRMVIERCPDDEGDWRVIIHSRYGRRVHEPWAMAITARLKQRYGFDGQAYAADDGIVLRLPAQEHDIDVPELIRFDPDDMQRMIETQVGETVLFAARFRECAARSLFLPRTDPGRRVPLWQQRLRAAQLLNAARLKRNFPLLLETARECLQDDYDMPALRRIMTDIQSGNIGLVDVTTDIASPFAENLLFGYVGTVMYQYDVPQAERSAQLLSIDPDVLERLLGQADFSAIMDPRAVHEVEEELGHRTFWNELPDDDIDGRVARYAKTHGPFTVERMMVDLSIDAAGAVHALDMLKARGEVLDGIAAEDGGKAWLHKEVFRRIRARSLAKARAETKPVELSEYQTFLIGLQGVGPVGGERYDGEDGVMRVIEQLEGVALPPSVWESSVLPARVRDYRPAMLDGLLSSGEIVWVGSKTTGSKAKEPGLVALHPADSLLLTVQDGEKNGEAPGEPVTLPDAVMAVLAPGGAYHANQLAGMTRAAWDASSECVDESTGEILPHPWSDSQFEEALWSLVWQGKVTNSSFDPLRSLGASSHAVKAPARASRRRVRVRVSVPANMTGLWSAVPHADMQEASAERVAIARVEALLDRYGVIAPPMIDKERLDGGFSGLYPVLRRMEEHGALMRGMFISGCGAAQFASRQTVDALRACAAEPSAVVLDATDPANLYGSVIAWPRTIGGFSIRPARRSGASVVLRGGRLLAYAVPRSHHLLLAQDADPALQQACNELAYALQRNLRDGGIRGGVTFCDANNEPLTERCEWSRMLRVAGFVPVPQGMRLYC